jgi:hypothetical protein
MSFGLNRFDEGCLANLKRPNEEGNFTCPSCATDLNVPLPYLLTTDESMIMCNEREAEELKQPN